MNLPNEDVNETEIYIMEVFYRAECFHFDSRYHSHSIIYGPSDVQTKYAEADPAKTPSTETQVLIFV